jgi:hypothetical protein
VTRHFQHRAALEDVDRAVRRALDLARDVRQFVDDALGGGGRSWSGPGPEPSTGERLPRRRPLCPDAPGVAASSGRGELVDERRPQGVTG